MVLKRPRTADLEFEPWANKVSSFGSGLGSEVSLRDFRKDVLIEVLEARGKIVQAYRVFRCWPSEYQVLTGAAVGQPMGSEVLVLEHEGWERDLSVR